MAVRLAMRVVKGKRAWVEADAPARCGHCGGAGIGSAWWQCPKVTCRKMCRQWPCLDRCGWLKVDPEHQHETAAPGVHRGG